MPRRDQLSIAVEGLLYRTDLSFEDLPRVTEEVLAAGAESARLKLLLCDAPLPKLFDVAGSRATRLSVHRYGVSRTRWSGRVEGRFGRGRTAHTVGGNLTAIQHPRLDLLWLVMTDASVDFLARPLRLLLRAMSPRPVAPIYSTPQIAELLELLGAYGGVGAARVTQLGHRGRISSKGARKSIERDRKWTDLAITEAFDEAVETGHWVTDARLTYDQNGVTASLSANRYGVFTFRRRAGLAMTAVLDRACTMAVNWYHFLRNRQRDRERNYLSRPFLIEYGFPLIEGPEQLSLLRKALSSIPAVACSVLHGNPYFHAAMTDFDDGSTYEVVVLSPSTITVLPQGRSTVRALQRLCAQLFSEFREGELREAVGVAR